MYFIDDNTWAKISPAIATTNGAGHYEGFTNRYQYTGREKDAADHYYYRARYYRPSQGRFDSTDPVTSSNLYVYVRNNPVVFIDPSGTKWTIVREGKPKGKACSDNENDTWEDLANIVGLNSEEKDYWVTPPSTIGNPHPEFRSQILTFLSLLDVKQGVWYGIPNTIQFTYGPGVGIVAFKAEWEKHKSMYFNDNYYFQKSTYNVVHRFHSEQASRNLYGYVFLGHGKPLLSGAEIVNDRIIPYRRSLAKIDTSDGILGPHDFITNLKYHLRYAFLEACGTYAQEANLASVERIQGTKYSRVDLELTPYNWTQLTSKKGLWRLIKGIGVINTNIFYPKHWGYDYSKTVLKSGFGPLGFTYNGFFDR